MLKNYFIVALRNFWRNKTFSFINIVGLSIGISASLVIFLLVYYDFTFDKFEKDRDRIYRVSSIFTFQGQPNYSGAVCAPLPAAVDKEMTGVDLAVPFYLWDGDAKVTIPYPDATRPVVLKQQSNQVYADARYFDLIPYTWLAGSPTTALKEPYHVVLTESNAQLYYPGIPYTQIIGKSIIFDDTIRSTVTGVVKDIEKNTDFVFKTFVSRATLETGRMKPPEWDQWNSTNSSSQFFLRLSPGTTTAQTIARLNQLREKHADKDPNDHSKTVFALQTLGDLHFDTVYEGLDNIRVAHKPTLYGLLAVAAFLLLLACINFINLTTAQATQRAKEIGIRKTMGSQRRQLAFQFLNETLLLTLMATGLSIAITPLLLKVFADFIPPGLHFSVERQPVIIGFLAVMVVAVSLLSGFYPALVMSSYKPVLVLKGQAYTNSGKGRSAWFRKSLTVSQFVIAQIFIIATILVSRQISYALHKDLGFKKEAIVFFRANYYAPKAKRAVLADKLRAIPEIALISLSTDPPSVRRTWSTTVKYKDGKKEFENDVQVKKADTNYIKLYELRLLAGANVTQSDTTNSILINETYAHILGFTDPQKVLGKVVEWENARIVGVVADFHQKSLHEPIKPLLIANGSNTMLNFNIALRPEAPGSGLWRSGLAKMERAFKSVYPDDDFEYSFVDETIAKYYTAEKNTARLLAWATGLAIFISCLGLLGLVIYITNQRTKEIGIRKVVGASVTQIVVLLSRDFMKLVTLAIVIALPIAWWGSHKWLKNFAYRASLSWWIFVTGGAALYGIALVVLCLRAVKAATVNPIKSLKAE